jgi:hypothetical protein
MSKRDWIWFAIRVFGVYLLVKAVVTIPDIFSSFFGLYNTPSGLHSESAELSKLHHSLHVSFLSVFAGSIVKFFIFAMIGIYLIRRGSWLFKILCPPDSGTDSRQT